MRFPNKSISYIKKSIIFICGLWSIGSYMHSQVKAQNVAITETQLMYYHDTHIGLNANSLGLGGIQFRKGWHQTGFKNHLLDVEFLIVQDPKESKRYAMNDNPNQYKFGKINNVFFLRCGYGKDIQITDRPYRNAISVHFLYSGGLNLTFLKPYYIEVVYQNGFTNFLLSEKFNPEKHNPYNIYGSSSFTEGINEIKTLFGAYGRMGLAMEWGQVDDEYRNLEFGCTFDVIPDGVPILYGQNGNTFFIGGYIGLNWGWKN